MEKATDKEYFVAFTVLTVLALLAVGFYFTYVSLNPSRNKIPVAYTKVGPFVVSNQTYSIQTSLSIQTDGEDAKWINAHKTSLESVLKNTISTADPKLVMSPNGLQAIQDSMKDASNKEFKTKAIQSVLFTDFVLVKNDSQ